jgi:hypothetical protein
MMNGVLLRALDGSNPLAFLAAVGALRLAGKNARMSWTRSAGSWRPVLHGAGENEEDVVRNLMNASWAPTSELMRLVGRNITVEPEKFASLVVEARKSARPDDHALANFTVAFGNELCVDEKKSRIEYTDLCFITGSGHQDFLGTADKLKEKVTAEHLSDSLFGKWKQDAGLSMRWDPADASEYALQWDDPGPKGASAVWGANRLAFESLPLFPSVPIGGRLVTTGFRWSRSNGRSEGHFSWPIWDAAICSDTARSLFSMESLRAVRPDEKRLRANGEEEPKIKAIVQKWRLGRDRLAAMGVVQIYRAQRVRIGQGANFKVSFRQAEVV